MTDWHDRLPPIPSQRIFNEVIREGGIRKDRRRQRRQRVIAFGGSLAAVATIVTGIVLTNDAEQDPNASSRPTIATTAATTAAADASATTEASSGATSPPSTEPEATEAAGAETTDAAETTQVPASAEVAVSLAEIWEQPVTGAECGPTTAEVTYQPGNITLQSATVLLGDPTSEPPVHMTVTDNRATATIGPYDPETLDDGTQQVLTVTVSYIDTAGEQGSIRSTQTVTLHDCP